MLYTNEGISKVKWNSRDTGEFIQEADRETAKKRADSYLIQQVTPRHKGTVGGGRRLVIALWDVRAWSVTQFAIKCAPHQQHVDVLWSAVAHMNLYEICISLFGVVSSGKCRRAEREWKSIEIQIGLVGHLSVQPSLMKRTMDRGRRYILMKFNGK